MIVINNGVPKSATTLIMEYQKSLIMASSSQNGLEEWVTQNNGSIFIPSIQDTHLETLLRIEREFGDLVIKMHRPPSETNTRRLVEEFSARVTCCYRDPRDIVLSAMDHGVRTRNGLDKSGAFGNIITVEDGAREFKQWARIYYGWEKYGRALMIKYEDLMADRLSILTRVANFLEMHPGKQALERICDKHEREKKSAWNFNKGTSYRWKSEMTSDQLERCNELLSEDITRMGYTIE